MGVDLRLLPFDCYFKDISFSHTILSCERERALFSIIQKLETEKGEKVPEGFTSFSSGEKYGETITDPYGESVKWLNNDELIYIWDTEYPKNKAILEYLKALPRFTKIALYWH